MPVEVEVAKPGDPAFGQKQRWDANAAPSPEQVAKPEDTGVAPSTKASAKAKKPMTTVEDAPPVAAAKPESVTVVVTPSGNEPPTPAYLSEKTLAEIAEGQRVLAQHRR